MRRFSLFTAAVCLALAAFPRAASAFAPSVIISGGGAVADSGPGPKVAHFALDVFFDYPLVVCQTSNPHCNDKTVHVCLDFHTVAESATAVSDFAPKSGTIDKTVVFSGPGDMPLGTIDIDIVPDALTEGPETFKVTLSNSASGCPPGANIGNREAEATIVDGPGPQPDLVVDRVELQRGCQIVLTLRNAGQATLPNQAYDPANGVAVEVQRNHQPWGGIRLSAVDPSGKLKVPGGSVQYVWFPKAANLRLPPGAQTLRATIDRYNTVAESNEGNNDKTSAVTCSR